MRPLGSSPPKATPTAAHLSGLVLSEIAASGAVRSLNRSGTPLGRQRDEREILAREHYAARSQAVSSLCDYIEVFYNRQRKHSTLGYLSPAACEARSSTERVSFEPA